MRRVLAMSEASQPGFRFAVLSPDDFPRMLNWLQTPHVKRWWDDGDDSLEKVAAHYGPVDPGTGSYLLWLSEAGTERPIGYFQYYTCPDGAIGIDQFIGEPDCIGRGLGPAAIRHFVAMLRAEFGQVAIELDPHPDNDSAIRCYEKVGFKTISLSETTRLMRLEL